MRNKLKHLVFTILVLQLVFISCKKPNEPNPSNGLVTSISIEGNNITDGNSTQMIAVVLPEEAVNKVVTWSVSNEDIATIDQNGLVTAVSNGNVIVTALATDGSEVKGTKLIAISGVTAPTFLVESITIVGSDITDGNEQQLSVDVLPVNATNKTVSWAVSSESIATIS